MIQLGKNMNWYFCQRLPLFPTRSDFIIYVFLLFYYEFAEFLFRRAILKKCMVM